MLCYFIVVGCLDIALNLKFLDSKLCKWIWISDMVYLEWSCLNKVLIQPLRYQAIHGILKTIEGPPNQGVNLPLSTKPTHSNSSNSSSLVNSKKDRENDQVKGQKKYSPPPLKKTKASGDLKSPPGSRYTCGECSCVLNSREAYVAHMRCEHSKVNLCTGYTTSFGFVNAGCTGTI